jgi:hypothetical protein
LEVLPTGLIQKFQAIIVLIIMNNFLLEIFLLGFSANRNIKALFKISSKKNPEMLHCLNGIRFFSMTWVVLGHVFGNFLSYPVYNKFKYAFKVSQILLDFCQPITISIDKVIGALLCSLSIQPTKFFFKIGIGEFE